MVNCYFKPFSSFERATDLLRKMRMTSLTVAWAKTKSNEVSRNFCIEADRDGGLHHEDTSSPATPNLDVDTEGASRNPTRTFNMFRVLASLLTTEEDMPEIVRVPHGKRERARSSSSSTKKAIGPMKRRSRACKSEDSSQGE